MKKQLGEIANLKYGKMPNKDLIRDSGYPIFTGYKISGFYPIYMYDKSVIIIVARGVGGTGDVKIAPPKSFITNLSIIVDIINDKLINKKYLQLLLGSLNLRNLDSGSAQSQITIAALSKVELDLPKKDIQDEIASKIELIERKIQLNKRINDNLTKLINLLFLEVYKSTLLYKPLKKVANVSNGYAFKSKELLDVPIDNSSPVFKMGNIKNNGGFDHTKIKSWVTPDYYPKDKFLAQYGDILMSMTDMKDNVRILGHTALMDVDKKYYINQRVCLIRPTELPFEYLYPLTNCDDYINELRKHANHGVQVNLTIKSIKDSKIRIPNNNQLQKYIKLVSPLFKQLINNNQENLIMSQIKCNLLNKFF